MEWKALVNGLPVHPRDDPLRESITGCLALSAEEAGVKTNANGCLAKGADAGSNGRDPSDGKALRWTVSWPSR